jgi:putative ABC transport system ATP-binding protein
VSEPTDVLVRATDLHRTYGTGARAVEALRGVSLQVAKGEMVMLKGQSGSGKTTLLNIVGGLDRPDAGTVTVAGRDVSGASEAERLELRRDVVSFVFQGFGLVPVLTARENVEVPLRLRRTPVAERNRRVSAALESVGLGDRGEQRPSELSGGEQQRVAIARAVVGEPQLLLADEPTGQLDSHTGRDVIQLLRRLVAERNLTVLVATRDASLLEMADRVRQLSDGVLVDAELAGKAASWRAS